MDRNQGQEFGTTIKTTSEAKIRETKSFDHHKSVTDARGEVSKRGKEKIDASEGQKWRSSRGCRGKMSWPMPEPNIFQSCRRCLTSRTVGLDFQLYSTCNITCATSTCLPPSTKSRTTSCSMVCTMITYLGAGCGYCAMGLSFASMLLQISLRIRLCTINREHLWEQQRRKAWPLAMYWPDASDCATS